MIYLSSKGLIAFVGGLLLLSGVMFALVYASQQKAYNQNQAAGNSCVGDLLTGECSGKPPNVHANNAKAGLSVNTDVVLSAPQSTPQCTTPVYLAVNYTSIGCASGHPCESTEPRTAVGWVGDATGAPFKYYANNELIPLTDANGVWLHDNPVYRSSPMVNALGITRLGDGRIVVTHMNPMVTKQDYNKTVSFQAIDAVMSVTGATTTSFTNGDFNIAPDPPTNNGVVSSHGADNPLSGSYSKAPFSPSSCGNDEIVWKANTSSWEHHTRVCWPGDDYTMKFTCPLKPSPTPTPKIAKCDLYPIALSKNAVENAKVGDTITDIWNGSGSGSFGWLTWTGNVSEPTLATSLTPPGNSSTYINPNNVGDHIISVGDWISSKPGDVNSSAVRSRLSALESRDIIVPVWDTTNCRGGSNAAFRTWNYAKVRITKYDLAGGPQTGPAGVCNEKPGKNTITATFKGFVNCQQ